MKYRFYPRANERLDEIWEYTVEQWDEHQAEKYIRGLFSALEKRAERKHSWLSVKESGFSGVYFFRYEHHFVFYRELSDRTIGVISILHERMDLPHRLKEDFCEE